MNKEQIRVEIARIINASCIDPPTRGEPDRPADCPADCGLCKADQILALFPQGDKIDGNALPSAAYDEYFTPPQGEGGHWIFKTDKLTPLQVMACVCQQCPFPGELETRCSWCDNPKMMEFLGLAIPAMGDFYQQHETLALKEQMEMVIVVIEKSWLYVKSVSLAAEDDKEYARGYDLAMNVALSELVNLKAELEGIYEQGTS